MSRKSKNKRVRLCLMVVAGCIVLATLWAVLATSETALAEKPDKPPGQDKPDKPGKGGDKTAYSVDAVLDGGKYDSPTLFSIDSGSTGENTLFVRWPFDAIEITPKGSSYALTNDPQLTVSKKRGEVIAVQFYIQDVFGPDGIMHSSDQILVDPPVTPSSDGFTLHVHADDVPVWSHKGHTGGPRVEEIGTISVGDIVFKPAGQ